MGCRLITGFEEGGSTTVSVFIDSVTETVFGPVVSCAFNYEGHEDDPRNSETLAEDFCTWLDDDPRRFATDQLVEKFNEYLEAVVP